MLQLNTTEILDEIDRLLEWVNRGGSSYRFISNHFQSIDVNSTLNSIKELAVMKSFIVSKVVLNERNDFFKLESVYKELVQNITPVNFVEQWLRTVTDDEIADLLRNISIIDLGFGYALHQFVLAFKSDDYDSMANIWKYLSGKSVSASIKRKLNLVGGVTKENVESFLLAFNRLVKRCGYAGWIVIFESINNVSLKRSEMARNEAYNNIRQLLDLIGANILKNVLIIFSSDDPNFIHSDIHNYKALAERVYPETDLYQLYRDIRNIIWIV
jgi:hypothetical protein